MGNFHWKLRERERAEKSPGMGKKRKRKRERERESAILFSLRPLFTRTSQFFVFHSNSVWLSVCFSFLSFSFRLSLTLRCPIGTSSSFDPFSANGSFSFFLSRPLTSFSFWVKFLRMGQKVLSKSQIIPFY